MIAIKRLVMAACAVILVGCGGSSPAISHRMPMDKIWHTPPEERDAVAAAHRALYEVQARLDHTRFQLSDTGRQAAIARAERDRAKQDLRIAELRKDRREAGFLSKLADAAAKEITSSRQQKETLDRKIRWLDERERYLRKEVDHLEAAVLAAEAKLELAKAELAVKRGAVSKDRGLEPFKAQAQRTESRAAGKRRAAEQARQKALSAQKAWGGSSS
jgi:hypothetical protein